MRWWAGLAGMLLCLASTAIAEVLPQNRLGGHASPYLALHAGDPVRWQPWNPDTLALARRLGRPLFVSSGFFACHWCHVMQRESFRNSHIAALLNTHFVPVKIDREIDTALDDALVDFVRASGGIAGWPLNVIVTPRGEPWHGFVYLPPDALEAVLKDFAARQLPDLAAPAAPAVPGAPLDDDALRQAARSALLDAADDFEGGFGTQARFPFAPRLAGALRVFPQDAAVRDFIALTLDAIVSRGLRDHIGGGFFRYTADPGWQVPHFEKMLADNAQLAHLLLDAADVFNQPDWRDVARETLDFLLREMRRDDGLFKSALSAVDGEGADGGHYLWQPAQLGRVLGPDELRFAIRHYGLGRPPRFDGGHMPIPVGGADGDSAMAETVRARLYAARVARALPADDKAVVAWNGLVLSAFARAATLDSRYREAGQQLADRLDALARSPTLPRAVGRDGAAVGAALLEDHVLLAQGLLAWSRVADQPQLRATAERLAQIAWQDFRDTHGWRSGTTTLLRHDKSVALLEAGHLPSPTAVLFDLARAFATHDIRWQPRADEFAHTARRWIAPAPLDRFGHLP